MNPLDKPAARRILVLSHPNHEAAIFGLVQRLRPRIVFLTDGGGSPRPDESRRALDRIGLLEHACFLDFREGDFYRALLDCDLGYFREVISRLRMELEEFAPEQVICDALEFYNPVHDLSLPIVRAALGSNATAEVFEAPLIYQTGENCDRYELQRFPASRRDGQFQFSLNAEELAAKLKARDEIYETLREQMKAVLEDTLDRHFATEVIGPAANPLLAPRNDQPVRYDWRARLLLARGNIDRAITREEHYLPLVAAMLTDRNLP